MDELRAPGRLRQEQRIYTLNIGSEIRKSQHAHTHLSIFKGDLSDQRHTLVLCPGVGQVEVGEGAEVDHVGDALAHWLVDYVVSTEALRLSYSTTSES